MNGRLQSVLRGLFTPVLMVSLALAAGPARAQPLVSGGLRHGLAGPVRILAATAAGPSSLRRDQEKFTYVVSADIDGHSILTLWRHSARWFHIAFAAPGRHDGMNDPTVINGTNWFPAWPQPGENRDCHCHSSTFRHVMPHVPHEDVVAFFFKAVSCRDTCSARYSNGALVIDFNDNPSSGDAEYTVKIVLTVDDAPPGASRI